MADIFKGLAGGFNVGMQLGQAVRERRQREELAAAYGLTPQEQQGQPFTPEQIERAQAEARALEQQDIETFGMTPEQAQRYTVAAPQEGARGLSTYTLGGQTFNRAPTQQEIDFARMRAAADVYGRYGDAARREEIMRGVRAEERALTAEQRAAAAETRAQQDFTTRQRSAELQIGETERQISERNNYNNFAKFASENPNLPVADLRTAARTQFNLTPKQEEEYILNRLNIQKADADAFKLNIQKKLQGKNLAQQVQLYNTDPDFDDKTDLAIVPGKGGAVTLNFIDKATGRITSTQSFKSEALATEYLAKQAVDPLNVGTWLQTVQKNESAIAAQQAQIRASDATVGLRTRQQDAIDRQVAATEEAAQIRARFAALTEEEKVGPKGQALIREFNLANIKAGAAVPLGPAPKVAPELPAPVMKRYEELIKSERWQRAPSIDAKIKMLEDEGISPAAVGLVSPTDALIDRMRRNAPPAARPQGTAAGQQLLWLADAMLPPAPAPAPAAPTTSRDRMRGLYLGQ